MLVSIDLILAISSCLLARQLLSGTELWFGDKGCRKSSRVKFVYVSEKSNSSSASFLTSVARKPSSLTGSSLGREESVTVFYLL